MAYDPSDVIGNEDDRPSLHQNKSTKGRTVVCAFPNPGAKITMETQIHRIELEAYTSVVRAFKAQSDAITWEKESLITELRKELKVSDVEHRQLLSKVDADDTIRKIREWRQNGQHQSGRTSNAQPGQEQVADPSVSPSRKRKASHSILSLASDTSSTFKASMQPSSAAPKIGAFSDTKTKKLKSEQPSPAASSMKSLQKPLLGQHETVKDPNRSSSGVRAVTKPTEAVSYSNLIGRKVMTRWPADNNFYEAVIIDYDPDKGQHHLVYDINTDNESYEWVNLKEISPKDIRWVGEDPGIVSHFVGRSGSDCGSRKPTGRGSTIIPSMGTGRGSTIIPSMGTESCLLKNQAKKEFTSPQNGIQGKCGGDIELYHTDTLLKEVERLINGSRPGTILFQNAQKLLKEHEKSLNDAIMRLANGSNDRS